MNRNTALPSERLCWLRKNHKDIEVAEEQKQEFWRWAESNWKNPDIEWKDARYITVGIDVGSVSSQSVIMADGQIFAYGNMRTGYDSPDSARIALKFALEATDMPEDRMDYCIGTGYGRVNVPFADRTLTEIACQARGAHFIYGPGVRTVLDVGGQDIKAIQCDEKGKVANFLMNDKCAAGTGRGMEVFADLLGVSINEVGDKSFDFQADEPEAVSSTCVVYAKSETFGLLRKGWSREEVLAAYCKAMAEQIYSLVERLGVKAEFAVTGGMAKNRGVMDRLMPMIGMDRMQTNWDPQIAGAVGAALFGYKLCQKGKSRKK
jgi:bzd-type benzoyl-CoA reductase Q subunit